MIKDWCEIREQNLFDEFIYNSKIFLLITAWLTILKFCIIVWGTCTIYIYMISCYNLMHGLKEMFAILIILNGLKLLLMLKVNV